MSDVKVNDVEDKNKDKKEDITSDESRDGDKDRESDEEPKKEVSKSKKKEATKPVKKEKTINRQPLKKKPKTENEETKSSSSNSSDKKVKEDDECEDDEDEKEDGDKKKPLLDQPLEMHGARERKKVERLAISFNVPAKDKKIDIPEGEGEKLGEIPIVEFRLQKYKTEELKFLHRVLFNRAGQAVEIRKNIRRFSGFGFKPESEEYEKKKTHLEKGNLASLKQICELLDVERSGTKEDLVIRILDFLVMPKSTGRKVPVAKGKRTRASSKAKTLTKEPKGRSSGRRSKKSKAKGDDSNSESSNQDEGDDEEEKEEEEDEEEMNNDNEEKSVEKNSDESEEEIVKPTKKEAKNKTPAKKEEKKVDKKEAKKSAPKSSNKRKKESSDEESSDDEPLAKKTKHPPTDGELKTLIEKILDGANLEEITMKTVCKQVYGTFPEFDLSDRKDFIKNTVKSIIS